MARIVLTCCDSVHQTFRIARARCVFTRAHQIDLYRFRLHFESLRQSSAKK